MAADPVVRPGLTGQPGDVTLTSSIPVQDVYVRPAVQTSVYEQPLNKTPPPSGPPATITGTLATTNANDTVVASGTAGAAAITGTLATTNADDTVVATGSPVATGASSITNANDSVVASGTAGSTTPPAAQGGGSIREYVYPPVTGQSIDDDDVALILALVG